MEGEDIAPLRPGHRGCGRPGCDPLAHSARSCSTLAACRRSPTGRTGGSAARDRQRRPGRQPAARDPGRLVRPACSLPALGRVRGTKAGRRGWRPGG